MNSGKMLRYALKPAFAPRLFAIRQLSGQLEASPQKEAPSNDKLPEKSDQKPKFDVSKLPENANDNFLIEFTGRKPTYDQLFEYNTEDKPFLKSEPVYQFMVSQDYLIWMHKKYDFSISALKRILERYFYRTEKGVQEYMNRRHGILGPDLATSHFILNRGGRARFLHKPDVWVLDKSSLPNTFDKKYRLISLDASNVKLMYEGLDNLILLNQLEELNLSGNERLDDFCCDKLARIFRNSTTLKYLDLSNTPHISHRGIEALYKIRSLKTLIIRGSKAAEYPFIELLALMFTDANPQCTVIYK